MPAHELGELVGGVLAAGVPFEQRVEVAQHLGDGLLGGGVGQALLEAGEALLHHLAPQPVEDPLVELAGLLAGPLVLRQLLHGPRRRARQVVQHGLREPGVVVVARGQRVALGGQRLVEQLLRAGHGAVEVTAAQRVTPHPAGPRLQVVETAATGRPAPQQVAQRVAQAAAVQHLRADRVDGGPHVVRRRQRVRPALPGPVAVAPRTGHCASRLP